MSTLAAAHDMTLPAFLKHLRTLEAAGFIRSTKNGRTVTCELREQPLRSASSWISARERLWSDRLDALARHLYQQDQVEPTASREDKSRKP